MTIKKGYLALYFVMAVIVGAAATVGAYTVKDKGKATATPSPSPTVTPTPSPTPTATPVAATSPLAESDTEQITRTGKAYIAARVDALQPNRFSIRRYGNQFACADIDGGYMILKKASGVWVPLYAGNGGPDEVTREVYGLTQKIVDCNF